MGRKHDELADFGLRWMKRQGCLLALKEPTCGILNTKAEIPDILAWSTGWMFNAKVLTTMIEAKVSYSDYLANSSKKGDLGNFRYWLFTDDLFKEVEEKDRSVYHKPWGILVRRGRTMVMVKSSEPFLTKDVETENLILLHALRQCGDFCKSMEVEDDGMDEIFNITACRHRLTAPQCSKWWRPFTNNFDGVYNHTACLFCKDFEPMDVQELLK